MAPLICNIPGPLCSNKYSSLIWQRTPLYVLSVIIFIRGERVLQVCMCTMYKILHGMKERIPMNKTNATTDTADVLVSVIMPNYNGGQYLSESVNSILKQSHKHVELIIIDDASTDNSWELILQYANLDKRVRPFKNKGNKGILFTRNKGLSLVSKESQYIAMLDSDDIAKLQRVKKQLSFLQANPEYGIVGSHIEVIDEKSRVVNKRTYLLRDKDIKKQLYVKSPFAQPAIMVRKSVMRPYERYEVAEDLDLYFRIKSSCKFANLDEYLTQYRVTTTQSKNKKLKQTLRNTITIKSKHMLEEKYFPLRAVCRLLLEAMLLLVPNKLIFWAFKKMEYR